MKNTARLAMFVLGVAIAEFATASLARADARADITPCSHLSASDAAKATGVPFVKAEVSGQIKTEYDPINSCSYKTAGAVPIDVLIGIQYRDGDIGSILKGQLVLFPNGKLTPVPGLGDEAYMFVDGLHVRRGHWEYHLKCVFGSVPDPQALVISMAKALK